MENDHQLKHKKIKILWICGLPLQVQSEVLKNKNYGACIEWSWVLGHLPPPEGIELHIACRTARNTKSMEFFYRGAHFHLVPVKARARVYCFFQFDWFSFRKVFMEVNPDVVHGWGTEDAYAITAIKLAPERHIVQVQGILNSCLNRAQMPWQTRLAAFTERLAFARAHCVTAENEFSLAAVEPMIRTQVRHVIEHPLRPEFLAAQSSAGLSKQVIYLGVIDDRKGIWHALEAFHKGAPSDWKMAIIGSGSAANIAKLESLISNSVLRSRVTHHPQLTPTEIIALMQDSSVLLLPTRIDTGPTALKESLVMGLWPICYDNGGPGHYIRKFGYGNLVDDLNQSALTEAVSVALQTAPWKQPIHQEKVETVIRPHFENKKIWKELIELYQKIKTTPE